MLVIGSQRQKRQPLWQLARRRQKPPIQKEFHAGYGLTQTPPDWGLPPVRTVAEHCQETAIEALREHLVQAGWTPEAVHVNGLTRFRAET